MFKLVLNVALFQSNERISFLLDVIVKCFDSNLPSDFQIQIHIPKIL